MPQVVVSAARTPHMVAQGRRNCRRRTHFDPPEVAKQSLDDRQPDRTGGQDLTVSATGLLNHGRGKMVHSTYPSSVWSTAEATLGRRAHRLPSATAPPGWLWPGVAKCVASIVRERLEAKGRAVPTGTIEDDCEAVDGDGWVSLRTISGAKATIGHVKGRRRRVEDDCGSSANVVDRGRRTVSSLSLCSALRCQVELQ